MNRFAVAVVAVGLALSIDLRSQEKEPKPAAQARPNFAGKWAIVMDSVVDPTAMGELGRNPLITHDDKTITVVTLQPAGELKTVYNLDGSESNSPITFGGVSVDRLSRIRWDGAKLLISTKMEVAGQVVETTVTWSLNSKGELVVDAVANAKGREFSSKRTYRKG